MSRTIEEITKSKGALSGSEPDSTASQTMKAVRIHMENAFRKKSTAVAAAGRKLLFFLLCVGLTVVLFDPPLASAQVPDGTIELSGGKIAAGLGYSWGSGTLIFQGNRYPLTVSGISLGSVGANEYTASGTVTGLSSPQDINGIYTRVGTGLTLGGGADIAAMRNENGVTIQLASTTEGLNVSLAVTGMKISIAD